jgi:hypothetical protein
MFREFIWGKKTASAAAMIAIPRKAKRKEGYEVEKKTAPPVVIVTKEGVKRNGGDLLKTLNKLKNKGITKDTFAQTLPEMADKYNTLSLFAQNCTDSEYVLYVG